MTETFFRFRFGSYITNWEFAIATAIDRPEGRGNGFERTDVAIDIDYKIRTPIGLAKKTTRYNLSTHLKPIESNSRQDAASIHATAIFQGSVLAIYQFIA